MGRIKQPTGQLIIHRRGPALKAAFGAQPPAPLALSHQQARPRRILVANQAEDTIDPLLGKLLAIGHRPQAVVMQLQQPVTDLAHVHLIIDIEGAVEGGTRLDHLNDLSAPAKQPLIAAKNHLIAAHEGVPNVTKFACVLGNIGQQGNKTWWPVGARLEVTEITDRTDQDPSTGINGQ